MSEKFGTISALKANHLFWLGRYAERVYLSLHFLRRISDELIDHRLLPDVAGYYQKLGTLPSPDDTPESFYFAQLYDRNNPGSLLCQLIYAHDNGIVLREEIKSESLAYIQLSMSLVERSALKNSCSILELQPVTDYMLAFFGCVYERVCVLSIRDIINIGRHLESLDMHLRFDYPAERILEIYGRLQECQERESELFNQEASERLNELLTGADDESLKRDRAEILSLIGRLVKI